MLDITIRKLSNYSEYITCENIQRTAWNMTDKDIVPAHMLRTFHEYGGIILGAFLPSGDMIGFIFGFVGRLNQQNATTETPYLHCSEMMGVLPPYRGESVGFRLKLEQRKIAICQGYRLIVWTYDPLLSRNAWLNIGKLGAICRHYIRDAYGQLGGIYEGLPTDRFEVEWWIDSDHVKNYLSMEYTARSASGSGEWVNSMHFSANGFPVPVPEETFPLSPLIKIRIPYDIQAIKQADMKLAYAWRIHTRDLFEQAFANGYAVIQFSREISSAEPYCFYVLTNQIPPLG
jgi:predicted GNAT superfamily acetyltransferase